MAFGFWGGCTAGFKDEKTVADDAFVEFGVLFHNTRLDSDESDARDHTSSWQESWSVYCRIS